MILGCGEPPHWRMRAMAWFLPAASISNLFGILRHSQAARFCARTTEFANLPTSTLRSFPSEALQVFCALLAPFLRLAFFLLSHSGSEMWPGSCRLPDCFRNSHVAPFITLSPTAKRPPLPVLLETRRSQASEQLLQDLLCAKDAPSARDDRGITPQQ